MDDYQGDYTQAWQTFLSQLKLKPMPTLEALDNALQELSSNASPLSQIVTIVQSNNSHNADFNALNNLPVNAIIVNLQQVATLANNIINAKDQGAAAFLIAEEMAKKKGHDPIMQLIDSANASPLPVKEWLYTMANRTRDLIFEKAAQNAWHQWQIQVLPLCQGALEGRYPFVPQAKKEVSLTDFARFFERGGIFNQFFTIYLSPFVDQSLPKWQWKNIDGGVFDHDVSRLAQFERANIIQMLFFNDKNQLIVPFSLNNQAYIWPVNTGEMSLSLGHETALHAVGPWSIFRLIDQGKLQPRADGQTYDASFSVNGHQANVVLSTGPLNPFIPGAMSEFRCP
jgi:type VI protein secretion system component VasK